MISEGYRVLSILLMLFIRLWLLTPVIIIYQASQSEYVGIIPVMHTVKLKLTGYTGKISFFALALVFFHWYIIGNICSDRLRAMRDVC